MAGDALEICDLTAEDSSPVNELSFSLQNLQCQDGLSPKLSTPRKLVLTPECIGSSLNTLSREKETPTVRRRRARSLSPDSTSNTPRCLWRNNQDFPANKENERAIKRLRVRLCSRFSSTNETETAGRNRRQYRSDPEEDATHSRETEAVDPMAAVRFCQLMSQMKAPPTPVTEDAVSDLTLIGDFSKQHLLPVESAGHQEHHCVSAQTVASLIRGQFGPVVEDFLIVDCRYPYEYQGGHIKGAVNLYTEHQVQQVLHQVQQVLHQASAGAQVSVSTHQPCGRSASDSLIEDEESPSRKLIIFHCEFSSERGPHLCQYLRRLDRCVNVYPNLHYPELYLLQGGYKHFHASYPDLCDPCGYVSMRQREYRELLNSFLRRKQTRQRRRRPIRRLHRTKR